MNIMAELRKYEEQLRRVNRWFALFETINTGIRHVIESEHYHDFVYSFFINCYHLKDWIIHDDTVDEDVKSEVSKFIKNDYHMKLCAKICNGTKHLIVNPDMPKFKGRKHELDLGGQEGPIYRCKFKIQTSQGELDAFELATKCVTKWQKFINDKIN
jgi:hypothetical protein